MGRTVPPLPPEQLPGRLAELLLARGEAGLREALELLVCELGLRSAVLREAPTDPVQSGPGRLRAVAGGAVHVVPSMRVVPDRPTVELAVRADGRDAAVLSVVGGRPSQLPVLRAVAAVLGLALSRPVEAPAYDAVTGVADVVEDLVQVADGEADATADLLHDGPVQALVVAHYAAEAAARGGDPGLAREAVQTALVELRRMLWHLRPRTAGPGGLPEALELLSGRLQEAGGAPVGFVVDELLAAQLPPSVLSAAYRLVQAVALADPQSPVRVALRRDGAAVALDIDGGGPLPHPLRWATKARALRGSLTDQDGRIRLVLPLPATPVGLLASSRPKATL